MSEVGRDDRCSAQLWRGRDLVLERDVALTLFVADAHDGDSVERTRSAVQRALRSARLTALGAARVLDVLEPEGKSDRSIAAVVAEWTPGRDLVELVCDELPSPSVAAGLLVPLAGAVDAAHRAGLILGCDHPQRIRVNPEGRARLAFPGAPPANTPHDDIRGLGATLYLLLTGYWPLPGGAGRLAPPPVERDGSPVSPRTLRPDVPVELSALALRCLAGSSAGGVHTGAAVQRVLEFNASVSDTELLPTMDKEQPAPSDPEQARKQRRMRLGMSVIALVAATLLILGYLGMQLASVFDESPDGPALIVGGPTPATPAGRPPAPPAGPPAQIPVADLSVYDVSGEGAPDNADDVGLLVDGDRDTGWSTDSYFQQFPVYKEGLGVMMRFDQPIAASSVTIDSPSPGTVLEVRAAPDPDAALYETTLLGVATLDDGSTQIQLQPGPPTKYLLLWITGLGGGGDHNRSELSEVEVQQRAI